MTPPRNAARVACIGGAAVDRTYSAAAAITPRTSNPATGRVSFGGVARNIAENLARLQVATSFATLIGDDDNGRMLLRHLIDLGVEVSSVTTVNGRATAEYVAILDVDGDLALGAADMAIFDQFSLRHLDLIWPRLAEAQWIIADCNLPASILHEVIARCAAGSQRLAIDAVSTAKIGRLPRSLHGVDLLFLNQDEALAYLGLPRGDAALTAAEAAMMLRKKGAHEVIVTFGAEGLAIASVDGVSSVPATPCRFLNATGAGDALIAGAIYRLLAGDALIDAARAGAALAALTTECNESVRPDLSPALLAEAMRLGARTLVGTTP